MKRDGPFSNNWCYAGERFSMCGVNDEGHVTLIIYPLSLLVTAIWCLIETVFKCDIFHFFPWQFTWGNTFDVVTNSPEYFFVTAATRPAFVECVGVVNAELKDASHLSQLWMRVCRSLIHNLHTVQDQGKVSVVTRQKHNINCFLWEWQHIGHHNHKELLQVEWRKQLHLHAHTFHSFCASGINFHPADNYFHYLLIQAFLPFFLD